MCRTARVVFNMCRTARVVFNMCRTARVVFSMCRTARVVFNMCRTAVVQRFKEVSGLCDEITLLMCVISCQSLGSLQLQCQFTIEELLCYYFSLVYSKLS